MTDNDEKSYEYKIKTVAGLMELGLSDEVILRVMRLTPATLEKIKRRIKRGVEAEVIEDNKC